MSNAGEIGSRNNETLSYGGLQYELFKTLDSLYKMSAYNLGLSSPKDSGSEPEEARDSEAKIENHSSNPTGSIEIDSSQKKIFFDWPNPVPTDPKKYEVQKEYETYGSDSKEKKDGRQNLTEQVDPNNYEEKFD